MASPTSTALPGIAPTRLQVALALAILKTKPTNVTVRGTEVGWNGHLGRAHGASKDIANRRQPIYSSSGNT